MELPTWTLWRSAWVYDECPPMPWSEPNLPPPHHIVRAGPIILLPECGQIGDVIARSGSTSFHPNHITDVHAYHAPVPMEIDEEVLNEDPVVIERDDFQATKMSHASAMLTRVLNAQSPTLPTYLEVSILTSLKGEY